MDLLALMSVFVRVVEAGSFTAVAEETGQSQPTISRQIAALEGHLGARLINRTTRALALTEEGLSFLDRARTALDAVAEAEATVGRRRLQPTGQLRLATPVAFGRLHIVPRLERLLARHPDLSLDLVLHDGASDLVEEGIDLAIRIGTISDPALVARQIGETRRVTVAAPHYLERAGTPTVPEDLARHACIVYTRLATGSVWRFEGPAGGVEVAVTGRFRANNSEAVREATLAGLGIAVVPTWLLADEIAAGRLTVLLQAFEPKRLAMHAVYPSRRYVPPRTRAAIDFFAAEFRLDPTFSNAIL